MSGSKGSSCGNSLYLARHALLINADLPIRPLDIQAEWLGPGNHPQPPVPRCRGGSPLCLTGARIGGTNFGGKPMDSARGYHELAVHCFKLAGTVDDPATQDPLVQLGDAYTRLAERAEEKVRSSQAHDHQAA